MKIFAVLAILVSTSSYAADDVATKFCREDVNLVPNTFVVSYDATVASVNDITVFVNVVGGIGHTVGLKVTQMGPRYNLAQTSIEKELTQTGSHGQFIVTFGAANAAPEYLKQLEPRALAVLQTIADFPGFRVDCQLSVSFSSN